MAFSPAAVHHLPGPVQTGIIDAFAHSLHAVFLWATPIALLTLPFVLILKELPLRDHAFIQSATMSAVGGEAAGRGPAGRGPAGRARLARPQETPPAAP